MRHYISPNWTGQRKACLRPLMQSQDAPREHMLQTLLKAMPAAAKNLAEQLIGLICQGGLSGDRDGNNLSERETVMVLWFRDLTDDEQALAIKWIPPLLRYV